MLEVVELIEVAVGKEMPNKKGAIIHDAWTNSLTHYFGIFGSYIPRKNIWKGNNKIEASEHVMSLLSTSPMMNVNEDDTNFDEAANFAQRPNVPISERFSRSTWIWEVT